MAEVGLLAQPGVTEISGLGGKTVDPGRLLRP